MLKDLIPPNFVFNSEVRQALEYHQAVVALESTVITHGLPHPQNLQLALDMEAEIRNQGAVPATTAILDGKIHVGLSKDELERIANAEGGVRKVSRRDFGIALARGELGGTTVAGTLIAARSVGIRVFATGGIGGVHRNSTFDISADLQELSRSPVIVVCAGAKAILDLSATMEYLETMGVPVIGYKTEELPAFYSANSGLPVTVSVQEPAEVAQIARMQWSLGLDNSVLVVVPPPPETALLMDEVEKEIQIALEKAEIEEIRGQAVTPFLLGTMAKLTGGSSLTANLALLKNNARVAAKIAVEFAQKPGITI